MDYSIFDCPYCKEKILIYHTDINCGIFRHGIYINTYQQINPHETKEVCDSVIQQNKIYGCGKPFRIIANKTKENKDQFTCEACDYI